MSGMRLKQVMRIIIGSFVLGSALLGYLVHPYWLFFTMFVGVNMIQSGFTKWCLLENILKKAGIKE